MPGAKSKTQYEDLGELLERLGDISPKRICMDPPPGTATEYDLLRKHGRPRKLYELVDHTLVEKLMGSPESHVATRLIGRLEVFLDSNDLGFLYGPDALIEVMPKLVRGPDVSFMSWKQRPERTVPREPISTLIPELAVEVLSSSNTRKEMQIKLKEYFLGGVKLVWIIDPEDGTAEVYTAPDKVTAIPANGTLDGGDILPGFTLPLATLFAKFGPPTAKKTKGKKKR
jgi:Uma2 family endonuclease